ncbi:MAG: hypothetical protein HC897_00845 [Thermoanaerobaculia bacterium]|nr:hypothetical protein [Thermoanaerobaculia bacterium]
MTPSASLPAPARPKRRRRLLTRLALILFGLLLCTELALRIAGHFYQKRQLEALEQARSENAKRLIILAMGESTTGGLWLPFEDSYPKQLERKLREYYGRQRIKVIVPPHIGQNTSHMVHRFAGYLRDFQPALVIIMAGVNNTWSLAESNLGDFLPPGHWQTHLFRLRRWSDDVKVMRLARLLASGTGEAWRRMGRDLEGAPMMTQWPPKPDLLVKGVGPEPFLQLWRSDVGRMIEQAQAAGTKVILMTYPNYDDPPLAEIEAMAAKWSVPLVENHKSFAPFLEENRAQEVFFDDLRHPNARGYGIVADNVLRCILENELLADKIRVKGEHESASENPAADGSS